MSGKKGMREKAIKRFNELLKDTGKDTTTLDYGEGFRYAVFSDLHMGDGTGADNFRQNEKTFVNTLECYKNHEGNYSIILLGDIEEIHQATPLRIKRTYDKTRGKSVYNVLREFSEDRIHKVFGNHDIDWSWEEPIYGKSRKIAVEAIKLKKGNDIHIMLTHGHQALESIEKDLHTVRMGTAFFRYFERVLKIESKSLLSETPNVKDEIYSDWTRKSKKILICGHTHCPISASRFIDFSWIKKKHRELEDKLNVEIDSAEISRLEKRKQWLYERMDDIMYRRRKGFRFPKSPSHKLTNHYFNTGGCLFNDAITNIEIDEDKLRLVYWYNKDNQREVLWEVNISSILDTGV